MWDYWEPWQPSIGDQVRARVSAECPVRGTMKSSVSGSTIVESMQHPMELDGAIGTVTVVHDSSSAWNPPDAAHRFIVELEPPVWIAEGRIVRAVFAAIELEPVVRSQEPAAVDAD